MGNLVPQAISNKISAKKGREAGQKPDALGGGRIRFEADAEVSLRYTSALLKATRQ